MKKISIIDSHTGGEPTRIVIDGGPDLGFGPLAARKEIFARDFDRYRSAIVNEPRGSDVFVGGLLVPPQDTSCVAGVIFFNNVGYLNMCGHGTIGLIATLAYLGRIQAGAHRIETPAGLVTATLHENSEVSVANVASHRQAKQITVNVPGIGPVTGDVAWGGNWFFLTELPNEPLTLTNVERLTELSWKIRQAINSKGYPEVDHIELFAPPTLPGSHSRNFVLCPGKAYDRSPCGTGTSAKLACLFADGKIKEGELWRQESIVGSTFDGMVKVVDGEIRPTIRGTASVNAETTLLMDERDPFCWGIR